MNRLYRAFLLTIAAVMCLLCAGVSLAAFDDEDVPTKYIVLMDASSREVLYEKSGYKHAFPASTTKIMTCILALELGDLDATVTVPSVTTRGSCLGIRKGEKMSLRSLLYGMMLVSGNDCAEAIAVHIGGKKDDFVKLMNEKAKEIGMDHTHFVEPSGLHKEEHYTTAYDFALLTSYALMESPKNEDFRAVVKRNTYTIRDSSKKVYELENSNKLVYTKTNRSGEKNKSYEYRGALGVKTGDTDYAMRCLVGAAEQNGVTLITVQFYDEDTDYRYELAHKLFEWGFSNFTTVAASTLGLADTVEVAVEDAPGGLLTCNVDLSGIKYSQTKEKIQAIQADAGNIRPVISLDKNVAAPIREGEQVATIAYEFEGETLFSANAYASRSVNAKDQPGESAAAVFNTLIGNGSGNSENTSSPVWLYITLGVVVSLVVLGGVRHTRNRSYRRKQRYRKTRIYRH